MSQKINRSVVASSSFIYQNNPCKYQTKSIYVIPLNIKY